MYSLVKQNIFVHNSDGSLQNLSFGTFSKFSRIYLTEKTDFICTGFSVHMACNEMGMQTKCVPWSGN